MLLILLAMLVIPGVAAVVWPKAGLWVYKIWVAALLIVFLLLVAHFYLGSTMFLLSWDLNPWREYASGRMLAAAVSVVVAFGVSQLPLISGKGYARAVKRKIVQWEAVLYIAVLLGFIIHIADVAYDGCPVKNDPGNRIVRRIKSYNAGHDAPLGSLAEIGLTPASDSTFRYGDAYFQLLDSGSFYLLRYRDGSDWDNCFNIYDSRDDRWAYDCL